jgi:Zn-finger nucleic acid-binding protein
MVCRACGAALEVHVFPGATVRCVCGADNVVPAPGAVPPEGPYRRIEHPADSSATREPAPLQAHGLGPLCPRCTRLLHDDDDLAGLACDRCGGVLVEHGVLGARLKHERPTDPDAAEHSPAHAPRTRSSDANLALARCPECGESMNRMNFGRRSGILIDVCRTHGTWFDGGELDAVLAFVRAGGIEADAREASRPVDATGAAQAMLKVAGAFDEYRIEQDASDLVSELTIGHARWRPWAEWQERWRARKKRW